ncbi:LPXTG cell wall anchor domain-containing protein [Streptomyces sp. NPDC058659]|uniref:LPXTG cell wall anchor domain-containing protein n=1 Tax=unclassified Streptomyces TaxID=2593676 RepID=UPI00365E505F
MKIRRILATAVAAAVTTPVVFLSAAPAFADTKPSPASTQKPASHEDSDDDDFAEYEKLLAAVEAAEAKLEDLKAKRKAAVQDVRDNKIDEALKTEQTAAKAAVEAAKTAKATADAALVTAEEALAKLKETGSTATPEEIATAEQAVTTAKTAAEAAVATKTAADLRLKNANTAVDDARVALARKVSLIDADIVVAEQDLADAEDALEEFEGGEICEEEVLEKDSSLKVALNGPKTVTAGEPAIFSLRVSNPTEETLEGVHAYVDAMRLPAPGELIDDETHFAKRIIPVEWSSADNLEWTPFTEEFDDSIEVGKLVKGGHYDVKLRLTVAADAPAGKGAAFSFGAYEKNDGDCGGGEQFARTEFDILAAKTDKPKPEPTETTTPAPTETTATPTPAPTVTTGGNTNTTQQGGSSRTPVNGTLAATGANDTLPLGLAAAGAVALGAGALVFARRRKAGANA